MFSTRFQKLDQPVKYDVVVSSNMIVHHVVAFIFAVKNIFFTCDGFLDFYRGDEACL